MNRLLRTALVLTLCLSTACTSSEDITVLVDYSHDEVATSFLQNFPNEVSVHPGAEVVFRQTWTGEPHTVTGGTIVDDLMRAARPVLDERERTGELDAPPPPDIMALEEKLPPSYDEQDIFLSQLAAQPCYIDSGPTPTTGDACPKREQPEFNGRQLYHNSGVIPYEGAKGNEYRLKLSDDIATGTYYFYCVLHGPPQYTALVVKDEGEKVDTSAEVARRAREQTQKSMAPLLDAHRQVVATGSTTADGQTLKQPFAGLSSPSIRGGALEFIPEDLKAKAGEPVTWTLIGGHTISFDVPEYLPIVEFGEQVRMNPKVIEPVGGAPPIPEPDFESEGGPPPTIDGGTYSGEGFWSSGLIFGFPLFYTIRFANPGTYRYACLIHPPMIGTLEVTA